VCSLADVARLREELVSCVKGLFSKGFMSSGGGNHSIRIPGTDKILITPSGYPRSHLKPEDIITIDLKGELIEGSLRPTIEVPFHTEIYRKRPDINAACHTHSSYTQALAISAKLEPTKVKGIYALDVPSDLSLPRALGKWLPLLEYRQLGSRSLAKLVGEICVFDSNSLKPSGSMVLLNHGVIGIGRCIHEARFMVELLEEWARCQVVAKVFAAKN